MIAPYVEQLATEYSAVHFIKVDVDDLSDVAEQQGITAMPTFAFFRAGKRVHEFRGASKEKLLEGVKQFAN